MIGFDSADESIMRDVQFRRHILKIAGHFVGECADRDATITRGLHHLEPVFVGAGLEAHVAPRLALEARDRIGGDRRSEEHTSELQSLMRTSYAVFCLKKKTKQTNTQQ